MHNACFRFGFVVVAVDVVGRTGRIGGVVIDAVDVVCRVVVVVVGRSG